MLTEFRNLSPDEQARMFDAIPLISVLIAGADGKLDERELSWAERMTDIRSFDNHSRLKAYYEILDDNIHERIQQTIASLPGSLAEREAEIINRLEPLNAILAKMPEPFGYLYYKSFKSFARHVAEAAGGFLRYFTVGPREAKLVDLPMLQPVPEPEERHDII